MCPRGQASCAFMSPMVSTHTRAHMCPRDQSTRAFMCPMVSTHTCLHVPTWSGCQWYPSFHVQHMPSGSLGAWKNLTLVVQQTKWKRGGGGEAGKVFRGELLADLQLGWLIAERIERFIEDQAFVRSNETSPPSPPAANCPSSSVFLCVAGPAHWREGWGGGGVYDCKKAWASIYRSILSGW
jgi:hypothetical protein